MATSEYCSCPPRVPTPTASHVAIASGVNHRVTSPRWTSARSYAGQFPTRYFVLYLGCTLDVTSRACPFGRHDGQGRDEHLLPRTNAAIRALCEATLRYQVTRVRDEFEADPEFRDVAADIPSPGALFAPYFYIAPDDLEGGLRFFSACAETAVSLKQSGPVHAVLCTDVSSLDSQEFLGNAVARIKDSGVSGVWLWFSRFYEEAASTPMLQEFRRFVEELSQHVSVFNMHGSYLSLALSRFGMSGISHGVGYGEQKDVIPVIGQSTPTVRYYLPDLKRRLGVPQIERALSNVGVKSTDDFFDKICGCVICRGVLGDSLGGFSSFGDLHYSTAESRRRAQTPAAAKQCRFHFLLNRARERDELTDLAPTVISRGFQKAYEKWKDQPTISGDVAHLLRWKRVFED